MARRELSPACLVVVQAAAAAPGGDQDAPNAYPAWARRAVCGGGHQIGGMPEGEHRPPVCGGGQQIRPGQRPGQRGAGEQGHLGLTGQPARNLVGGFEICRAYRKLHGPILSAGPGSPFPLPGGGPPPAVPDAREQASAAVIRPGR